MEKHVKILAVLFFVYNIFSVLLATFVWTFFTGAGISTGEAVPAFIVSGFGAALAAYVGFFSLPGLITAWGLSKHRRWARVLTIILGVLGLFSFPLGTVLGVYTLWVLLDDDTALLFRKAASH